jgi:quercetin dioxygenase-like cupin family protein
MYSLQLYNNATQLSESPKALKVFESDDCHFVRLTLKTGESIPLHKNPVKVIFYVLEGIGNVQVESETITLSKGDSLMVSNQAERSWSNNKAEQLELLVVKLL